MNRSELTYIIFGAALVLALVFDLGLLNKKGAVVTVKKALFQTLFWVLLALAFGFYLLKHDGHEKAIEYVSAYLMEWSLSIDNIFVFILLFSFMGVREKYYGRALLIGVLLAVVFRILFIASDPEQDERRLQEAMQAAQGFPSVWEKTWFTTVDLLRENQAAPSPLGGFLWQKLAEGSAGPSRSLW